MIPWMYMLNFAPKWFSGSSQTSTHEVCDAMESSYCAMSDHICILFTVKFCHLKSFMSKYTSHFFTFTVYFVRSNYCTVWQLTRFLPLNGMMLPRRCFQGIKPCWPSYVSVLPILATIGMMTKHQQSQAGTGGRVCCNQTWQWKIHYP